MKKIFLVSIFIISMTSFQVKGMDCDEGVVPYLQNLYIPVMSGAEMRIDTKNRDLVVETFEPKKTEKFYTIELVLALTSIRRGYRELNLEIPEDMRAEIKVPTTVTLDIKGDKSKVVWQKKSE